MGSGGRVFGPLFDLSIRHSIAARMAGFAYVVSLILVALGHLCLYAFLSAVAHATHDDHTGRGFGTLILAWSKSGGGCMGGGVKGLGRAAPAWERRAVMSPRSATDPSRLAAHERGSGCILRVAPGGARLR